MPQIFFISFLVIVFLLFFIQYPDNKLKFFLNNLFSDLRYTEKFLFYLNWVIISVYIVSFFLTGHK